MSDDVSYDAIAAAGGTLTLMARLTDMAGDPITQADVQAIEYTIYEARPDGKLQAVADHTGVALTIGDVIFETLQTGPPWTIDAIGYNFRHTIDVATAAAFAAWGQRYVVVYTVTLTTGYPIVWRWVVRTPEV